MRYFYVGDLDDGPEKLAAWKALRERYSHREESRADHGTPPDPAA